jgi:hypothetical protein
MEGASSREVRHVQDVGRILLDVEKELAGLRRALAGEARDAGDAAAPGAGRGVGARVEDIIARAEKELRLKAELVLAATMEGSAQRAPVMQAPAQLPSKVQPRGEGGGVEAAGERPAPPTVRDLLNGARRAPAAQSVAHPGARHVGDRLGLERERELEPQAEPAAGPEGGGRSPWREPGSPGGKDASKRRPLPSSLSKLRRAQTPPPEPEGSRAVPVVIGASGEQLSVLEMVARGIVPAGTDVGAAFTSGANPAVLHGPAPVYRTSSQERRQLAVAPVQLASEGMGVLNSIKLDVTECVRSPRQTPAASSRARWSDTAHAKVVTVGEAGETGVMVETSGSGDTGSDSRRPRTPSRPGLGSRATAATATTAATAATAATTAPALGETVEAIRAYDEAVAEAGLHIFLIREGKLASRSPEFLAFRRAFAPQWGAVTALLGRLEELLLRFQAPLALVDGGALAALASDETSRHSNADLLSCVRNRDQVAAIVRIPGRQFVAATAMASTTATATSTASTTASHEEERSAAAAALAAQERAAVVIASAARAHKQRKSYLFLSSRTRAARRIQSVYRVRLAVHALSRRLQVRRAELESRWAELQRGLGAAWPSLRGRKRTIVHVPSLSLSEHIRLPAERVRLLENLQMARVAELSDPDVSLVCVVPFALPPDVLTYYHKLLRVGGVDNTEARLTFVVPENAERFPQHLSLATLLYYSPHALRRVRRLTQGQGGLDGSPVTAFIAPGSVGEEDRTLALALRLPLLAPSPEVAAFYGSKSGSKRLFAEAGVGVPPGVHDIYEMHELVSALARLIAASLDTQQWLLKVDDESHGRGLCVIDVTSWAPVADLRRDRAKQAGRSALGRAVWSRPDVQESARRKLERALGQERGGLKALATVCCRQAYPTWERYLEAFLSVGGVVEAVAPQPHVLGSPSAQMLLEPDGHVRWLGAQDQVFSKAQPFARIGGCFPQQTLPHAALKAAATAVANAALQKGIWGHIQVDFVVFRDPIGDALRVWAVDLNIKRSQAAVAFQFFALIMGGGGCNETTGEYLVRRKQQLAQPQHEPQHAAQEASSRPAAVAEGEEQSAGASRLEPRCFAALDAMHHPNLVSMDYPAFFNVCRLHGVAFDLETAKGVAFKLYDSLASGTIGAICVDDSPQAAKNGLLRALQFVHKTAGRYVIKRRVAEDGSGQLEPGAWDGTVTFTDALAASRSLLN